MRIRAIAAALLIATLGCASFEKNLYRGVASIEVAVDAGMKTWGNYVFARSLTDAQQAPIKSAYEDYQKAMAVLEGGVATWKAAGAAKNTAYTVEQKLDLAFNAANALIDAIERFINAPPMSMARAVKR